MPRLQLCSSSPRLRDWPWSPSDLCSQGSHQHLTALTLQQSLNKPWSACCRVSPTSRFSSDQTGDVRVVVARAQSIRAQVSARYCTVSQQNHHLFFFFFFSVFLELDRPPLHARPRLAPSRVRRFIFREHGPIYTARILLFLAPFVGIHIVQLDFSRPLTVASGQLRWPSHPTSSASAVY